MRTIIFSILFFITYYQSFSQDLKYRGPMTESIFFQMTPFEKILYLDCLEHMNIIEDNIDWMSLEQYNNYKKRKNFSSITKVEIDNKTERIEYDRYLGKLWGKNIFTNPRCYLSLDRKNDFSRVKIYLFY